MIMMPVLLLVMALFLAKIVLIDSPVGQALGDAIRNRTPPRAPEGAASLADVERLRADVEDLRDRLERVIEEQSFLTRLLSQRRIAIGPGESENEESRT